METPDDSSTPLILEFRLTIPTKIRLETSAWPEFDPGPQEDRSSLVVCILRTACLESGDEAFIFIAFGPIGEQAEDGGRASPPEISAGGGAGSLFHLS